MNKSLLAIALCAALAACGSAPKSSEPRVNRVASGPCKDASADAVCVDLSNLDSASREARLKELQDKFLTQPSFPPQMSMPEPYRRY